MRCAPLSGPRSVTALMPAFMAAATAWLVSPSMTISSTALMSGPSWLSTTPRKVGAKASLVDAIMPLYLPPIFEPERTMPPGNGMIAPTTSLDRIDGGLRGGKRVGARSGEQQKVAAAHGLLGHAGRRLAEKLAVHHRNPPEMPAAQLLGNLPAVAEIAQRRTELQLERPLEAGETGAAGRCQHALPDPVQQLLLQLVRADRKDHHAAARPTVGRRGWRQFDVDRRLAAAADDRSGEARHRDCRLPRPFPVRPGDDDRGRPHAEGFGEGVVDGYAVDF